MNPKQQKLLQCGQTTVLSVEKISDISSMISAHEVKKIRVMVKEEEKWFMELENLLIDESGAGKLRKFEGSRI